MANEFKIKKGLIVTGASGGTVVDIQGSQGQLFSVTDDLSGSIFAVSDISGVPILDVNSSGAVNIDGTLIGSSTAYFSGAITTNLSSEGTYFTGGSGGLRQLSITSGTNTSAHALHTFNIASSNGKYRLDVDGTQEFILDSSGAAFSGTVGAVGSISSNNYVYAGGGVRVPYAAASKRPMIVLNNATTYGLFHTEATQDIFSLDFNGTAKQSFDQLGNATFVGQGFSAATSSGDGSSTLTTKGYVDGLITASTSYRGTWDPDITANSGNGTPDLSTVTQTSGYYYICSDIGTAHPNGTTGSPAVPCEPDSWEVGDWVVWNDDVPDCAGTGTGAWQKIDNTSVLSGIGTGQTVALWEGAGSVTDSETLGNAPITVSGNDTTFAGIVTGTSFSSSTDSGININGITMTRVSANSAIRVADGLETLGLLRSYAGLVVGTSATIGSSTQGNTLTISSAQGSRNTRFLSAGNGGYVQYESANDGIYGYIGSGSHLLSPVVNDNDFVLRAEGEFAVSIGATEKMRINSSGGVSFAGTVTAPTFQGDLNGTINTATTGTTQTAGNNSTLIATTAYADAAAAAVPIGDYVTLSTAQTISGAKTLTAVLDSNSIIKTGVGTTPNQKGVLLNPNGSITVSSSNFDLIEIDSNNNRIRAFTGSTGQGNLNFPVTGGTTYEWTLPLATGTIALTSDIGGPYLPLSAGSGEALTGDLYVGTSTAGTDRFIRAYFSDNTYTEMRGYGIITNRAGSYYRPASDKTQVLAIGNDGNTWNYVSQNANYHTFGKDTSEWMRIDTNGNVGIGTTSPDTLLDVSSANFGTTAPTIRITNTLNVGDWSGVTSDLGRFEFFTDDTSGNAPYTLGYIGIKNDYTTGTPTLPSGAMVFATTTYNVSGGAVERMRIDSSGNVGIGTSTPNAKLDIQGTQGQLFSVTDNLSGSIFAVADISGVPIFDVNSSGVSYFDGNVGIGTTSPGAKLEVNGQIIINSTALGGQDAFSIYNSTNQLFHIQNSSSNDEASLLLGANNVIKVKLDTAGNSYFNGGNVGIGETAPGEKLEVAGNMFLSNDNSKIAINQNLAGTPSYGYADGNNGPGQLVVAGYASSSQFPGVMTLMNRDSSISANQDLGVIQFVGKDDTTNGYASSQIIGTSAGTPGSGSSGGGILRFLTTPNSTGGMVERMRIDNLGNVTIGKTTAALGALDVAGTLVMSVSTTARFKTFYTSGYTFINGGVSGNDIYFGAPSTYTQNIKIQGTATATNFILSSDKTLKDNIEEIDAKHIDVKWKNFELKSEPGIKRSGVIAQELEKTNPEFVRTDKEGLKSVAYIDLLITKIAELEARLEKAGI